MVRIDKAIQFLVSPQKDFIGHIRTKDGKLPNKLHVGRKGIKKLRGSSGKGGHDPFVDTTLKFFNDKIHGSNKVYMVLDEDWHNSNDPEFEIYGRHCIKGSEGAKLVGDLEKFRWHDRVHSMRTNSINPGGHPVYRDIVSEIMGGSRPEMVHVGIYGVWTNIKVEYLAVSLMTIEPYYPPSSIGILEPLCTAPEKKWHEDSIEKLNMLGFNVFNDIQSYLKWMGLEI